MKPPCPDAGHSYPSYTSIHLSIIIFDVQLLNNNMMKTDLEIKNDVLEQLAWQPNINETQIGVVVEEGVVTLTGFVDDYSKKSAAEKAVKKVKGVKAIAEDIQVRYGSSYQKTDKEIAKAVVNTFEWNTAIQEKDIEIKVDDGWVWLSGEVQWGFQKNVAKRVVEKLYGVKGVINNINIKQAVAPTDLKEKISKAFERLADVDAHNISVYVEGSTVKLKGKVHSLYEKDEARRTAYCAPGVHRVENDLEVV